MNKLQTIQGNSLADALAEVRRLFGDDAVILHTRTVRRGGLLGVGARTYVEITAAPTIQDLPPTVRKGMVKPRSKRHQEEIPAEGAAESMVAVHPQRADAKERPLVDEVADLAQLVEQLTRRARRNPPSAKTDQLASFYKDLIAREVAEELAGNLVADLRSRLTSEQLADPDCIRRALIGEIARLLPEAGELNLRTGPGPTVVAVVGPTGVGKTTTIAKLAARYTLQEHRSVGLVSLDTRRIAAAQQLQTYADILDAPFQAVTTVEQLRSALDSLAHCDLVLVDTAGCSPQDAGALGHTRELLAVAAPDEIHLALSATTGRATLDRMLEGFTTLSPDRVIFTKLDEAVGFGVLVSCLERAGAKLSYVTTGQEIPGDIEVGAGQLAQRLVGRPKDNVCLFTDPQ